MSEGLSNQLSITLDDAVATEGGRTFQKTAGFVLQNGSYSSQATRTKLLVVRARTCGTQYQVTIYQGYST